MMLVYACYYILHLFLAPLTLSAQLSGNEHEDLVTRIPDPENVKSDETCCNEDNLLHCQKVMGQSPVTAKLESMVAACMMTANS